MARKLGYKGPTKINETTLQPQVRSAFSGWEEQVIYVLNTKTISDGDVVVNTTPIKFIGMIQPLGGEELKLKPEGQRSWNWFQIHSETGIELKTDDAILINDFKYKIMKVSHYTRNGYYEYHAVRDYEAA